jgi:hypothetical protein
VIFAESGSTGESEMRRMISMMSMPALFLIGMTALSPAKAKQDANKDAAKATAALEERVKALEKQVADQQDELTRLGRFADGVAIGVGRLAAAGDASKEHGFESAGPNPAARTDLLEGIKSLQESVKKSLEKSDAEKAKEEKEAKEAKEKEEEKAAEEKAKEAKEKEGGGN